MFDGFCVDEEWAVSDQIPSCLRKARGGNINLLTSNGSVYTSRPEATFFQRGSGADPGGNVPGG